MKYVVLFKETDAAQWDHVGAYDVPEELSPEDGQALAVEMLVAGNGVAVAIPWDDWVMFRVESKLTVERVPRREEIEAAEPETDEPEERGGVTFSETFADDPDMAGLKRMGE